MAPSVSSRPSEIRAKLEQSSKIDVKVEQCEAASASSRPSESKHEQREAAGAASAEGEHVSDYEYYSGEDDDGKVEAVRSCRIRKRLRQAISALADLELMARTPELRNASAQALAIMVRATAGAGH